MTRLAAVAAAFGRDLDHALDRVATLVAHARRDGVHLLVLPDAALGGYLTDIAAGGDLPPALPADHPALARVRALAGDMVVCVGYREQAGGRCFNTAIAVHGDGVLGRHRKVHQPPGA
jgi:predicted amidohydrolase